MATPMTPAQRIAALDKWKAAYSTPFSNWKTHNRDDETGKVFGPVHGLVVHHTGADDTSAQYLYSGETKLPGPLCQYAILPTGMVVLVGHGRANHAGGGDPAVLQHVIKEDYTGQLTTRYGEGDEGAADGNDSFYGVEIVYSGNHGMSAAQYAALLKLAAGICDFHGWTEKSVIGHYEWNTYKWDPGYAPNKHMDMSAVRSDIGRLLKAGPGGKEGPVVATKPQAYKDVWDTDAAVPPGGLATTENPTWAPMSILTGAYVLASRAARDSAATLELVKKIAAKVGV